MKCEITYSGLPQEVRRVEIIVGKMIYSLSEQRPGELQIMSTGDCHPVAVVPVAPNVVTLIERNAK